MRKSGFEICIISPIGGVIGCFVDFISKICVILVNDLSLLVGRLLNREGLNLASFLIVRLSIIIPQWIYLACYFSLISLARKHSRLGWVRRILDHSSERFTLGHTVVAIKRE